MREGVIYVAQGPDYLDLAIQSAGSLKRHNPEIAAEVFTDQPCDSPCFDRVLPIPDGPTPKLACLPESRFQRTLYLDCDTVILAPLGDLFDILERFPLAVAHDVRRTSNLIREGGDHDTPYAFPQLNGGVILYRDSAEVRSFLLNWQVQYRKLARKRDQVSLRDLLWSSDLRFYVLPPEFNLRRVTMLDAWEPLDVRPTIMHSHRLLQHMRMGDVRLSTLAEVLPAERIALAEEWDAVLGPLAAPGETADPTERFSIAEAGERSPAQGPSDE
ncbi:hypothetical protein [Pseudoruegeria sp. HB172150]|uniref:hypothetical protein n=1 Tax=Pseudoruegeria sp. HB172150 TaxID=2721164 RepID=UPI001C1315C9|nr:hypothetical protein [Pseudoruegeria sp. HB172150]